MTPESLYPAIVSAASEHPAASRRPAPQLAPLEVICGPMFAGKTTELLRRIDRARTQGLATLAVKPARDTRYSAGHLVTHTGVRLEARRVATLDELLDELVDGLVDGLLDLPARSEDGHASARGHRPELVAIDEIHFFASDAVAPIDALRARGVGVIVAGCDLDHFGETFAPFDALLPRATEVVRLAGTCARCGAPSTHSERLVATTERIVVGGHAEFVATCARCFRPSRRDDGRRESTKD